MDRNACSILIVDDEPINLEILAEQLMDAGYRTADADCGETAWEMLRTAPEAYDAVLLDRMMPGIDGIEVLHRIKQDSRFTGLPVIMQTARSSSTDVLEGLQAGAYYYLTKPFQRPKLLAIVDTAVSDYRRYRDLRAEAAATVGSVGLMTQACFRLRSPAEAKNLASLLSHSMPQGQRLIMGLNELLLNAVEHGNLGISYKEKTALVEQGRWAQEVDRRLQLPENRDKTVELSFARKPQALEFLITDQGEGFDWRDYLSFSPQRAFDNHGRGIAMSLNLSFDRLEYRGKGNQVLAVLSV